jgi:predicted short-subunit dehydrogenase-like oxidoreductase (DUF2520 family)
MVFAIVGSGNVATHFSRALKKNRHQILQVWSRNFNHAQTLAEEVDAKPIENLTDIHESVDCIILAVNDDALPSVLEKLTIKQQILLHTSGTLSINLLSAKAINFGVLYPLQTLSKKVEIDFSMVPLCVEGSSIAVKEKLLKLAKSISNSVYEVDSSQRKTLHIAAVFASNFTNYFYAIADDLLRDKQIQFEMLKPLIQQTAHKILTTKPIEAQTGPAIRNDVKTIESHLSALSHHPQLQLLYKLISEEIAKKPLPF